MLQHFVHQLLQHKMQQLCSKSRSIRRAVSR